MMEGAGTGTKNKNKNGRLDGPMDLYLPSLFYVSKISFGQCFAGKSQVLKFIWMLHDSYLDKKREALYLGTNNSITACSLVICYRKALRCEGHMLSKKRLLLGW